MRQRHDCQASRPSVLIFRSAFRLLYFAATAPPSQPSKTVPRVAPEDRSSERGAVATRSSMTRQVLDPVATAPGSDTKFDSTRRACLRSWLLPVTYNYNVRSSENSYV